MATYTKTMRQKERYIHGSAAPKRYPDAQPDREFTPANKPAIKRSPVKEQQRAPGVSLFAIIGFFTVATLMIFVMLAQVNYTEVLRENARLSSHIEMLREQQRVLSITFESIINMDEIERYAKDVLGMSRPEAEQATVIRVRPPDRVEVIQNEETNDRWRELSGFLSFLFDEYVAR